MWRVRSAFEADDADTDCADDLRGRDCSPARRRQSSCYLRFQWPCRFDGFTGTGFAQPMSGRFVNIAISGNSSVPIGSLDDGIQRHTAKATGRRVAEGIGRPGVGSLWNDNESRNTVNPMTMRATSNSTERSD